MQTSNPGRIFENLIIMPLPAGGASYDSTAADIHAYDVRTGKLAWVFHTIPHPGEFGYDTWPPDAWKTVGGVHNWNEMTVDEKRGIAYIPLGTARYDFYGANRKGNDLFANSLLALDARTGKRLWHFQMVHHDLWDYDLPGSAQADHREAQRQERGRRGAGHQIRIPVRLRPRHRRAAVAHRRAPGAAVRRCGRMELRHAAFSHQASAVRAAILHREGHQSLRDRSATGGDSRAAEELPQRGIVHAAQPARNDFRARPQRRSQLGQRRSRPHQGLSCTWFRASIPRWTSWSCPDSWRADAGWTRRRKGRPSRAPAPTAPVDDSFIHYNAPINFINQIYGTSAMGPPWSNLTAYDLNAGTIMWQVPNGGVLELEQQGHNDTGARNPARRTGGHRGRPDLRRHGIRSQGSRLRSGHRQGVMGARSAHRLGWHSGGL